MSPRLIAGNVMTIKNTKIIKELPSSPPLPRCSAQRVSQMTFLLRCGSASLFCSLSALHNAGEYVNIFLRSIVGIFSVEWMSDAVVLIIEARVSIGIQYTPPRHHPINQRYREQTGPRPWDGEVSRARDDNAVTAWVNRTPHHTRD